MEKMFERAVRGKLRFDYRGQCTVEDLWDLNVQALDSIYKKLKSREKAMNEDSLLETRSAEDTEIALSIDIVKHIVETKLAEKKSREEAADRKAKKEQIMTLIANKQNEQLAGKSIEELQQMVADL